MSEISQSAQKQIIKNRIKRRRRCDRISSDEWRIIAKNVES